MGFWHTGYIEFHEPQGIDYAYQPVPETYPCAHCKAVFGSLEALRKHRLEEHPQRQPALWIAGTQMGASPFRFSSKLDPHEISVENADAARLNGKAIALAALPGALADTQQDTALVELSNADIHAEFRLEITVASDTDLTGVETAFLRLAKRQELNIPSIECFIRDCDVFSSAAAYSDGLCRYLHAVLAKEQAPDTGLPYDAYRDRFNHAADVLKTFDRPLARATRALISFHFNHFEDAWRVAPPGRLKAAAEQFMHVVKGEAWQPIRLAPEMGGAQSWIEDLLTDHETRRILEWARMPMHLLAADAKMIDTLIKQNGPEYDRAKLRVLLAEGLLHSREMDQAERQARAVIGSILWKAWAENLLGRLNALVIN